MGGVEPAKKVDLSNLITIIKQLNLGSCTANSAAQLVHAAMVQTGLDPSTPFFSRLFAYFLARFEDGNQAVDAGSQNCTVIDAICRVGFCPETIWPYDVKNFAQMPPPEAFRRAFDQRGKVDINYHRIDTVSGSGLLLVQKQTLTAGSIFNFAGPVTNAFCRGEVGTSPDNPAMPPIDGQDIAGGHSMTAVGYDDTLPVPVVKVANSWGKDYGDGGFCYLSQSYMTWSEVEDMWMVRAAIRYSGGAS